MGYVYCITNLINSKRYVGKTTQSIEDRFKQHCQDSKRRRCEKRPLYDAMNKYGVENFIVEELEFVEDDNLLSEREIYWIQELRTYGSSGYNASKGGDGKILYDHNEIIELAKLGYTTSQISEKLGCHKDTIYKILKMNHVKIRRQGAKIIAQYDLSGNFIQIFFGANEAQKWLQEYGITNYKNAKSHILECCNGKSSSCYGYKWKQIDTPN